MIKIKRNKPAQRKIGSVIHITTVRYLKEGDGGGGGGGINTYAYYTKQETINGNSFGSTVETFNSRAMDELHQKQHSVNIVQGIPSQ